MTQISSADKFFKLQEKIPHIPFTQSRGWYDYVVCNGSVVVFYVDSEQEPKIMCWGVEYKIPFSSKKILRIEGESYQDDLTEKVFKKFYASLTKTKYIGVEINSNNTYNIEFEVGIRRSGFKRPIGFFSSPLTIEVDFKLNFKFDNNWKRNVKKAVKNELQFKELKDASVLEITQISDMFKELSDLKGLGFLLKIEALQLLIASKSIRTFMVYDNEKQPIAARIIHENKQYATDIFAANSMQARNYGATYFMMEQIFEKLKNEGCKRFDFGRIPPSNHATDSVYVFKNTSRGKKIQYNGEWAYYKNNLIEGLMYFYKRYVIKKQQY